MTANNNLEINGRIIRNPIAELVVEISQIKLSGSLRISTQQQKFVVYFDKGELVFAVSNARKHRLFEILLTQNQISKADITKIDNFTNDFYLVKQLVDQNLYTKENVNLLFCEQIRQIFTEAINIQDGEWTFSSLARIKDGIRFDFDINPILYKYAKELDVENIFTRFKSFDEEFCLHPEKTSAFSDFSPQEAFILSRIDNSNLSIDQLKSMSGLQNHDVMQALYCLWLGGFILRHKWHSAFSLDEISKINSSKLIIKTSALSVEDELEKGEKEKALEELRKSEEAAKKKAEEEKAREKEEEETKALEITLSEYLQRVDDAATHYDIFDVSPDAKLSEIKKTYFSLAKKFHPDLYHKQVEPELHQKIQNAFIELAHAYETLKDEETREVYDFKLRKVIEKIKNEGSNSSSTLTKGDFNDTNQSAMAAENFENGYNYLMNDKYYEALPYLGRAVHLEANNPRYRAFYGKALSYDRTQYHKAESELRTAVKLSPENSVYRIMLAELFIEIKLFARAKGELTRLLAQEPDNKEAKSLLDSLTD